MTKLAISAEWTKFWSVRATWWCLLGGALLMVFYTVVSGVSQHLGDGHPNSAHGIVLAGAVYLVEFCVVSVATLFVTSEYTSGSIRSTLQWVPVRPRVTVAKAAVLVPVLFGYGVLVASLGMAASTVSMGGAGAPTSVAQGTVTAVGMGAFFAFLGLLAMGISFALRSAAGTLVTVMVLLLPLPMLVSAYVIRGAMDYFPAFAGANAMVPGGEVNPLLGNEPPYQSWVGIVVCLAWGIAGLAAGTALLRRRDA
ncbi:ABC transporter permease [Amycolatopsis benzoatilytica]|uniref:ABC transporter permease n=1 Tax=Amycolatopsis benzoatilytica TaxID=346045 RepID=UPI0003756812|nr:ABC transporter permease [Amycolatopsis benzoatilytica]